MRRPMPTTYSQMWRHYGALVRASNLFAKQYCFLESAPAGGHSRGSVGGGFDGAGPSRAADIPRKFASLFKVWLPFRGLVWLLHPV